MAIDVLVVDNNPVHLKAVTAILEKEGCSVTTATNGLEALEKIQSSLPDILFTDLVMPMVDGEKLCKIVRGVEEYRSIFVVVLSAIIMDEKEKLLEDLQCDAFIVKGALAEMRSHIVESLGQYAQKNRATSAVYGSVDQRQRRDQSVTKELIQEKEHLQRILENLSEGVIEISDSGKILSINSAAIAITGREREEVTGLFLPSLGWGDHTAAVERWCRDEISGKGFRSHEISEEAPLFINGRVATAMFIPVVGEYSFGLCIMRDISRQYRAEKKKEEMDSAVKLINKMDAMSCMAGGVAHDLNNLLTVICGNLDMIADNRENTDTGAAAEYLHNARMAAYSTVDLVRKISNFSPFGIIQRSAVSLDELVRQTAEEFFADSDDCSFDLEVKTDRCEVSIDPAQITTVITNVLSNAVEACPREKIRIIIDTVDIRETQIRSGQYVSPGKYVRISVADSGAGIEKKDLFGIFDPYYSTKDRGSQKGMGLGLTIVYSTLRNHAGYVVVDSIRGEGTTVELFFPHHQKEFPDIAADKQRGILVIEPDHELRSICKIMLEYLKYDVVAVSSGEKAYDFLENTEDVEKRLRYALVNLSEEGKRTGIEICRELKAWLPHIKVVVCGSIMLDPVMSAYQDFGFSAAIGKPYTMEELRKTFEGLH